VQANVAAVARRKAEVARPWSRRCGAVRVESLAVRSATAATLACTDALADAQTASEVKAVFLASQAWRTAVALLTPSTLR